jgi:S1-C subfamily serine protease
LGDRTRIRGSWVLAYSILVLGGLGLGLSGFRAPDAPVAAAATVALTTAPPVQVVTTVAPAVPTAVQVVSRTVSTVLVDEQAAANAMEAQVEAVYQATSPSVVNITNRSYIYYRFMGSVPQEGTGSGFVYDTQGHILTNYHVIENADELLVTLADGQVYPAEVVGSDSTNDLAVLHIDAGASLPPPLTLGDSRDLKVGQTVLAIGNPFGLQRTLTTGVVSALGRVIESPDANQFIGEAIQTDAAINPGNSGGPMLDLQGRVIGINSQILSTSGSSAGIGFAVSANTAQRVVPRLIQQGYYPHAWLGADFVALTSATVNVLQQAGIDLPTDSGLLVLDTTSGGPADRAGIRAGSQVVRMGRYQFPVGGDIIVAVDGKPLTDLETLTLYLEAEKTVGDTVTLTVRRDNAELTVSVILQEQPR